MILVGFFVCLAERISYTYRARAQVCILFYLLLRWVYALVAGFMHNAATWS